MTLVLLICGLSYSGRSQDYYPVTGDNLFRQYLWGVGNHDYFLTTKLGSNPPFPTVILNTSTSICSVWDGFIQLNVNATAMNNTLRIRPTSVNDDADYINGVSTGDLILLQRHILGIQPFTTGYQKVSADVNSDNNVTAADVTMLQQFILGVINKFTRNSWEWFHYQYVNQFPTGFFINPYQYTLKATYPNVNGFGEWFIANQSRNYILANLPDFTSTKVGDIGMLSGGGGNSWLCSPVPYLRNEDGVQSRTSDSYSSIMKQGDVLIAKIYFGKTEDIIGAQLPIYIDPKKFRIESVELLNGFDAKYHYNADRGLLTFLFMDDHLHTLDISDTEVAKIKLKASTNINNPLKYLRWDDQRQVELISKDLTDSDAYAEMRVEEIITSPLEMKTITDFTRATVHIKSSEDIDRGEITVTNMQGQILSTTLLTLASGSHIVELPVIEKSGMYIATLRSKDKIISNKFIVQN